MSHNSEKNIDQLFKQKLEGFELSSQDSSWKMLQLAKVNSLRLEKIFYVKTLLEMTILLSTALFIVLTNQSSSEKTLIKPQYIQEAPNHKSILNKEDYTSDKIDDFSFQQATTADFNTSSSEIEKNEASRQITEENLSDLLPELDLNIKQERQLLASESSTIYKNWSRSDKITVRKTSVEEINSLYDEYAPVINKDGSFMFFTSRRPVTDKEIRKGQGRERIYYTETNATGWTDAKLLQSPLNSEKNFNSAVSLSKDGKSLFIYRDDRYGNGNLYESKLSGYNWSTPEALPSPINSEFHESSLSLSSDGNTIYFTSNRDGGVGGMDIWYTKRNKAGMWGEAKNLGNTINTKSDEEGVFIHPDGKTLYFSSRGHKGMGGYDIYYTTLENGKWTTPVNLGPDINTKNDDVYFVLEENGTDAYYTSVNPKTSDKKDIFRIYYNHESHQKTTDKKGSLLEGTVLTKNGKTPIKAKVEVYIKDNNTLIATIESDAKTGRFSIPLSIDENYRIHIYKQGYLYHIEEVVAHSIENGQVINKNILLDQLQNNSQFILKELIVSNNKISFDRNVQSTLDELHQLMIINPELTIQLLLETNSNEKSIVKSRQRTIDECISYLKLKGINKNRINGKVVLNELSETDTSSLYVNIISI